MERRENKLLDLSQGFGLTAEQRGELDSLQAELSHLGSPLMPTPAAGERVSVPCRICGDSGTVEITTALGTIAHTCECVNVLEEITGAQMVLRRMSKRDA